MGIISGGGGGGSVYTPPTARASYSGNGVTILNSGGDNLTWNSHDSGPALLDLTVPDTPTVVTAGIYAVSANFAVSALTAGGYYTVSLELDVSGDDAEALGGSFLAGATLTVPLTYYIPAGGGIIAHANNNDGAASRNFSLSSVYIQRIT